MALTTHTPLIIKGVWVSKQGVMTFAWRPGSQYDVAATRGADSALASDCRAQFGRPSTRRGCRICVTVRLPVRPRGETMYWQANANTPLSVTPPFKCALFFSGQVQIVSRTLSGLFLVGALNRPRKRKRTNQENPRTIPEQIRKIPGKVPKGQKKDKKGRTSPDRETPPFETPPFSGP